MMFRLKTFCTFLFCASVFSFAEGAATYGGGSVTEDQSSVRTAAADGTAEVGKRALEHGVRAADPPRRKHICDDDPEFKFVFENRNGRRKVRIGCGVVELKAKKRCRKRIGGVKVRDSCPSTCGFKLRKCLLKNFPEMKELDPEVQELQINSYIDSSKGMSDEAIFNKYSGDDFFIAGSFTCCRDNDVSDGCERRREFPVVFRGCRADGTIFEEEQPDGTIEEATCRVLGIATNAACCRISPDDRSGSRNFIWQACR
jgi:hypothetical protein